MRTPEEVSSVEDLGADPGPTDQARLARAAVGVDLAAVVVLPGWTTHRLGRVLVADGVDGARLDPVVHQHDQVFPEGAPLADPEGAAGTQGVHAVPEEHLCAVDVADAGDDLLVEQQVTDRPLAAADPLPRTPGVGVVAQRVRAEAGDDGPAALGGDQLADDG